MLNCTRQNFPSQDAITRKVQKIRSEQAEKEEAAKMAKFMNIYWNTQKLCDKMRNLSLKQKEQENNRGKKVRRKKR